MQRNEYADTYPPTRKTRNAGTNTYMFHKVWLLESGGSMDAALDRMFVDRVPELEHQAEKFGLSFFLPIFYSKDI